MRLKALHQFTNRLPLIEVPTLPVELIGTDTETCMLSGVVNGIVFELEHGMAAYRSLYPELKVLLCGGDAPFFESIIKGHIFAFPNLVLQGLNHTLLYNAH
jgi:type III pantothenate kinase